MLVFTQLQARTAALLSRCDALLVLQRRTSPHTFSTSQIHLFGHALKKKKKEKGTRVKAEHTHREVFAVEFEVLPHADEQVEVEVVEQQMNGHVPLSAGLQEVTQQLHVAEAVHHYGQGLHRQVLLTIPMFPPASRVHEYGNVPLHYVSTCACK